MEMMTDGKPCRACTDFTTWANLQKKTFDSEQNSKKGKVEINKKINNETITSTQRNCPLDKDELGRSTWNFLHTVAAVYPNNPNTEQKEDMKIFFRLFAKFYPCNVCAEDLKGQLKRSPPETDSQHQLSQWLCAIHNEINEKLGKPKFNCKFVNERWRDGWKDGSCD